MWVSQTRHGFLGPPSVRSASSSTRLFNELPLAFALRYHLELEARRSSEPSSVPRFRQAGLALGPRRVILPSRPRYLRSIVRPSSSVTPQVFFMLTKEAAAGSLRGWPHAGFSFPARVGPDTHHTFGPMIDCNRYFREWKDPWRSDEFGDSGSFQFR